MKSFGIRFVCFFGLLVTLLACSSEDHPALVDVPTLFNIDDSIREVPAEYPSVSAAVLAANNGDTIQIAEGTFGTNVVINKNLTLEGVGAATVLGGINFESVFRISGGTTVTLQNMTIAGGRSTLGGGIRNEAGNLTLNSVVIRGSTSFLGGGISNEGGTVSITNSEISGNTSDFGGAGIYNEGGTVSITNSEISGNTAGNFGGGIHNDGGTINLTNITLKNNEPVNCSGTIAGKENINDLGGNLADDASCGVPVDTDGDGVSDNEDAFPNDPTRAVSCLAGSYGAFECTEASPGYFVATDAALEQTACPIAEFQNESGQTSCKLAPVGTFVSTEAAIQATPCQKGFFQDQQGQSSCIPAPLNTYVDIIGAALPIACPAGQITLAVASTDASDCIDPDSDDDGVSDANDLCPDTDLTADMPPSPKKNRFFVNSNGDFVDGKGNHSGFNIIDAGGCSASQIIEEVGLGNGHKKFGISKGELIAWVNSLP